jgi:hypothetical protein
MTAAWFAVWESAHTFRAWVPAFAAMTIKSEEQQQDGFQRSLEGR